MSMVWAEATPANEPKPERGVMVIIASTRLAKRFE
jgi:hypothetical protein